MGLRVLVLFFLWVASLPLFAGELIYFNRKTVKNPDLELFERVEGLRASGKWVRVLDTNPERKWKDFNLAPESAPTKFYHELSSEEREQLVFRPYLEKLRSAARDSSTSFFIHIDHHYDQQLLKKTSTTPMTMDFALWLHDFHRRGEISDREFGMLTKKISESTAVLDHSDADILFSNLVLENIADEAFLRANAEVLKSSALFNDHLIDSAPSSAVQAQAHALFYMVEGIEKEVAAGKSVRESFLDIEAALKLLPKLEEFLPTGGDLLDSLLGELQLGRSASLSAVEFDPRQRHLLDVFLKQFGEYKEREVEVRSIQEASLRDAHPHLRAGRMLAVGPLLVVFPETDLGSATTVLALKRLKSPLLQKAKVVLTISTHPQSKTTFMKLRSLGDFDLDLLYPVLKSKGLNADGRSGAGEGAYGKNGANNPTADELGRVVETIATALREVTAINLVDSRVCADTLAKVNQPPRGAK